MSRKMIRMRTGWAEKKTGGKNSTMKKNMKKNGIGRIEKKKRKKKVKRKKKNIN
jgi:hypothetical protein